MQTAQTRLDPKGAMALATSISNKSLICTYCSKNHDINNCLEFSRLSRKTCINFLQDRRLCFACGSTFEHYSRRCAKQSKCKIWGKWHLTALHIYNNDVVLSSKCIKVNAYDNQSDLIYNSMIYGKTRLLKEILCYCILECVYSNNTVYCMQ